MEIIQSEIIIESFSHWNEGQKKRNISSYYTQNKNRFKHYVVVASLKYFQIIGSNTVKYCRNTEFIKGVGARKYYKTVLYTFRETINVHVTKRRRYTIVLFLKYRNRIWRNEMPIVIKVLFEITFESQIYIYFDF